jgi:hypothetical protein
VRLERTGKIYRQGLKNNAEILCKALEELESIRCRSDARSQMGCSEGSFEMRNTSRLNPERRGARLSLAYSLGLTSLGITPHTRLSTSTPRCTRLY